MKHVSKIFIFSATSVVVASAAAWACNSAEGNRQNAQTFADDSQLSEEVIAENPGGKDALSGLNADLDREAQRWADSVMAKLTTRQRIAQLFIPRLDISNNAAGQQKVSQMIGTEKMGGFLLGKGSIDTYAALINKGQSLAQVPLMITLDGEWGLSMRIPGTPRFPYNVALGAADSEDLMYEYGKEVARECKLMGIQVNFAPDIDVNSNPDNPVIGYRSFGEDPELVGRLGAAYCRGMSDGGIMPVGKHFPGHGDTSTDSHKTLPVVDHSVKQLREVDFKPFEMAIKAGMPGVMVGHLKVPSLDASGTPSSLSKIITTDWLRDSLGFEGLVFTDALAMKGAARPGENNCVSAFLAGADILLGSASPVADLNAVEAAVKSGKISKEEVDRRCRRMLKYKYLLGLTKKPHIDSKTVATQLTNASVDSLILAMSRRAVTVIGNDSGILPLGSKKTVIVNIGAPAKNKFSDLCKTYGDVVSYSIDGAAVPAKVLEEAKHADKLVLAVYRDASWAKSAFKTLSASSPSVGVFFINPFKTAKFTGLANLKSLVLAYDDIPQLRTAAAEVVFGKQPALGKLPVNIRGIGKIGDGINPLGNGI